MRRIANTTPLWWADRHFVRLLFDHNCPPRLCDLLADLFPDSVHVYPAGLSKLDDRSVWNHAGTHGLTIVTKDADFADLAELLGFPPKVIWLRIGNSSTNQTADALRRYHWAILALEADAARGVLVIR